MEIWLDTANVDFVSYVNDLGVLQGITTNPTILSLLDICPQQLLGELLNAQNGLVAVQVLSDDVEEMCKQANILFAISNRILVKIPATQNGIRAIYLLNQEGIPTLATAIFEPRQALLAFKAGAHYLAPYLGRIADTGENPIDVISKIHLMKMQYGFNGKIMAAGIRELTTALTCLEMGISAMTLSEKIFRELIQDSKPTLMALEKFSEDWSKSIFSKEEFYSLHA